jgi:SAM-dependent methyltransferase
MIQHSRVDHELNGSRHPGILPSIMTKAYQLVQQLNAAASAAGTTPSIAQFDNIGTQSQYRVPYEVAARYVRAGAKALDWGCGNGHFSLLLEALGADVTGYSFDDPPPAMARSSKFRHVRGNLDDPRTIPFPDASFDVVCSVGVLEHVWETGGDERASLAEIARILKPGGVFLTFHLPNKHGWIEKVVHVLPLKKHFHHRKYTGQEIRTLWSGAGLAVEDIGLYNALPRAELRLLPGGIRHSDAFVRAYNTVDDAVRSALPIVCTNYFVVGRKR